MVLGNVTFPATVPVTGSAGGGVSGSGPGAASRPGSRRPAVIATTATATANENASATAVPCPRLAAAATMAPATPVPMAWPSTSHSCRAEVARPSSPAAARSSVVTDSGA
jgi:hypothetical protein